MKEYAPGDRVLVIVNINARERHKRPNWPRNKGETESGSYCSFDDSDIFAAMPEPPQPVNWNAVEFGAEIQVWGQPGRFIAYQQQANRILCFMDGSTEVSHVSSVAAALVTDKEGRR